MANLAWAIFNFIMTGLFMVMMIIGVNWAVKSLNNHQVRSFIVQGMLLVLWFVLAVMNAWRMCFHLGAFFDAIC